MKRIRKRQIMKARIMLLRRTGFKLIACRAFANAIDDIVVAARESARIIAECLQTVIDNVKTIDWNTVFMKWREIQNEDHS